MVKIKINTAVFTTKYKIILLIVLICFVTLTTYSVAYVYNSNLQYSNEIVYNKWISEKNVCGIYDFDDNTQIININNISNILFTTACNYSNSMSPTIRYDSLIAYIEPKEYEIEKLKIGDIIIYEQGDISICHRIVDYVETNDERGYLTKGDNNTFKDNKIVHEDDIKGIVVGVFY